VLTVSIFIALMTGAANTSRTSLNIYQTTRRNYPDDSHLHNRRRENLRSLLAINVFGISLCLACCSLWRRRLS
jgi:hypothetical protein